MPGHDDHDLERALRAQRPEARDEFVQDLAAAVRSRRHSAPRPRFGLAFALSLSILMSLFAFGGVGAASSALHSSAAAVRSAVGDDNGKGMGVAQGTPSDRQYHHTVFICLPASQPSGAQIRHTARFGGLGPGARLQGRDYPVPAGGCSSLNG